MTISAAATKPAMRSRGVVGSAVVILTALAQLRGIDIDEGLQAAIVENIEAWIVLVFGTIALIGRLGAAARVTLTRLW